MFKNKILVKAAQSAPSSSFFLLPLSLSSSSSTADPHLSVELEVLSWKLSRKWRLACIVQPFEILVVYQKSQSDVVDRVVSEFLKFDPSIRIGIEEKVHSGSLIAKAVEIGLRCVMLDHKWTCIGDNTFVNSAFSTDEERTNVHAVNVQVQLGVSDDIIFLVSPETLRFSRRQMLDFLSSKNVDKFENKREVILETFMACTTLPSLFEGYVIGVSKLLPEGESFNHLQDLWSIKHGLTLKSDHYVAVQFCYGGSTDKTWFPSSFVLQGSGLTPAPKTIRVSQAMVALQSFIRLLDAWDFLGCGTLITKEQSLIGNCVATFSWEKVTHNLPQCIINTDFIIKDPLLALDFRTPKPDIRYSTGNKMERENENSRNNMAESDSKDAPSTMNEAQIGLNNIASVKSVLPDKGQTPLLVPSFTKIRRKIATKSSAPIRSKTDDCYIGLGSKVNHAQAKSIHDKCQITVNSRKNETVLLRSPTECLLKTQTSAAVQADKHVKSTLCNTSSVTVKSVKCTKKNDAAPNNKFTSDTRIVLQADDTAKKSQNKEKKIEKREEGLEAGKIIQSSDKRKGTAEHAVDAPEKYSATAASNCQDCIKAVPQTDASVKKIQTQKKIFPFTYFTFCYNKESTDAILKAKAKTKQILDKDEITTKVLNSHKRGQMQSLTVADLKCFLSCKKAKVGGTKEELIRRVTDFLD